MSLLRVEKLRVSYGPVTVVDDVSFSLDRGASLGIVGESGSGKSQTALALLGLLGKNATIDGSVSFDGAELLSANEKTLNAYRAKRIGLVFQDPMQALNPYLSIGRQLGEVLRAHGLASGSALKSRVIGMLSKVGLPDPERQARAYPHELSGGMRQRAMIAAALIAEPDLLLADEPTTALDVTVQAQVLELLEALRDDTALLLITHDLGVVAGRCEHLLVMQSGRIVESGSTQTLFSEPSHPHTKSLLANASRLDRPVTTLLPPGEQLLDVEFAGVRYKGKDGRIVQAVTDVDVSLARGETLAIVGESGSGKSSLAAALVGLIPLNVGRIVFAGNALASTTEQREMSERRDMQLVFQDSIAALNPAMRIDDIVAEPLRIHEPQLSQAAREQRVLEGFSEVGLDRALAKRYVHQLSGGQAQRVALLRSLILKPRVLVCDEAVAALDGSIRSQILDLLRDVQVATGLAIVFISHDLAVVRAISHRVMVMYLGRTMESNDSDALLTRPKHPYTRALIDAVPVPDPSAPLLPASLTGEAPSPVNPPDGCVFHTRCRYAVERCRTTRPALRHVGGSNVACHLADDLDLSR